MSLIRTKREWFELFRKTHKRNPEIYTMFKRFTLEAIENKHRHIGGNLIMQRVRWETSASTSFGEFKINESLMAYYVRFFCGEHPIHKEVFRKKKIHPDLDSWIEDLLKEEGRI